IKDGCSVRAAALSYNFLLSLVPLLVVIFTILTVFPLFSQFPEAIENFIFNNFIATSAELVQAHFVSFINQATRLPTTSMFFLIVTAMLMVYNLEQAFNAIWHVRKRRRWVPALLLYAGALTLIPVLIAIGLVVSSYFLSLSWFTQITSLKLKRYLLFLAPYLSAWAAFTILYVALPNCKVRFRHALFSGLFAAILFELAKQGFAFYIKHFPFYQVIYGALAGIVIFLAWIYLCWLITLLGAVVCAALGFISSKGNLAKAVRQ
ncbi:MAG: YihY family inner membrane protein, partial [Gammaproteobacteria bacterium]